MSIEISEVKYELKKNMNGCVISKNFHRNEFDAADQLVNLEIELYKNNKILLKRFFEGSLTAKASQIKQIFSKCEYATEAIVLKIRTNACIRVVENDELLLLNVFCVRDNKLIMNYNSKITAHLCFIAPKATLPVFDVYRLQKLTIENIEIKYIAFQKFIFLKYLKLRNNKLLSIVEPPKLLEYCNLSNNQLKHCNVMSKVLILESNMIKSFECNYKQKLLNLSNNPLDHLVCFSKILVIRNTNIKNVALPFVRVIVADGTENIKIGNCPHLRYLSLNHCELKRITCSISKLLVFKAANNYFETLGCFKKCKYIDLSGNFLECIAPCNVKAMNVSMNQIRQFDFRKYPRLKHLNISFNPIDQYPVNCDSVLLKTVILNNHLIKYFIIDKQKTTHMHLCNRSKTECIQYKMCVTIQDTPVTFVITLKTKIQKDISCYICKHFSKFQHMTSILYLIDDFSNYLYNVLQMLDSDIKILVVAITRKNVLIRSFGIPAVIYTFAAIEILENTNHIYVYNNLGGWLILPLMCKIKTKVKNRSYVLSKNKPSFLEILHYLNYYCVRSLNLVLYNQLEYYVMNKEQQGCKCILISNTNTEKKSIEELAEIIQFNNDLGVEYYVSKLNIKALASVNTTSNNQSNLVYLFSKLCFGINKNRLIEIEKYNIFAVIDFYCKIFDGILMEKNYRTHIIQFTSGEKAAFFGLTIAEVLKPLGIDVSIGIATGILFRSLQGDISYVGGPVFNKAARLSNLGIAVYCCGCLKIEHPSIMLTSEGLRYLKGFNTEHKIYSLKFTKKL